MSGPIQPERSDRVESDGAGRRGLSGDPNHPESPSAEQSDSPHSRQIHRVLFLDDDPRRAEIFLVRNPDSIWIQTAQDCIARLAEFWDEVYLDHDLGGEHFVDVERDDCGMEVVRWLCREPRAHLNATRFVIHSHNLTASLMMVLLMRETGYNAEFLPFGFSLEMDPYSPSYPDDLAGEAGRHGVQRPRYRRLLGWLARLVGLSRKSGQ